MSTMIMNIAIPTKPANYSSTFGKKASELQRLSSTPPAVTGLIKHCSIRCIAKPAYSDQITTTRRSGNYNPPLWDFNNIQSLSSEYREDKYMKRASELMLQVKMLLEEEMEGVGRLELIVNLQKMGISYHFEDKIKEILKLMYLNRHEFSEQERDLYSAALEFRLLRQHGFSVSQELFDRYKNKKGEFMASLANDTKGLLQLYEASFLSIEGEESLEQAREFSTKFLQKKLDDGIDDDHLSVMVQHALVLPLHWRNQRLNARLFIDAYGSGPDMNPLVLELAKLDFNILQATYQEELKHVSRWWEQSSLAKKLPFARDRSVENYLWALGELFQPEYGYQRIIDSKVNILITIVDDIFDVYGTFEELQIFYDTFQRWDIAAMNQLPDYMQMCVLAVDKLINEMAYEVLKEQGFLIVPYLRKAWADITGAYIREAKWYSMGYTPTLEEYISNAWISVGGPLMLCFQFFVMTNPIENEVVQDLYKYHNIIRYSSMIIRLANDLETSQDEIERGDVAKSVECYMNEAGVEREEAREYVKSLIRETWKKINQEIIAECPFSQDFIRSAVNLARFAQYLYQDGDGHGVQIPQMKGRISGVLFEPIV